MSKTLEKIGLNAKIAFQNKISNKRKNKVNIVIGYSGRIIDINHLGKNINSKPEIILMHGDRDEVVPLNSLLEAKDFFNKKNYKIQTKIFKI